MAGELQPNINPQEFERLFKLRQVQQQARRAAQSRIAAGGAANDNIESPRQAQGSGVPLQGNAANDAPEDGQPGYPRNKIQAARRAIRGARQGNKRGGGLNPTQYGQQAAKDNAPVLGALNRARIFLSCDFPSPFNISVVGKELMKFVPLVYFPFAYGTIQYWYVLRPKIQMKLFDATQKNIISKDITYTLRDFFLPWEWVLFGVNFIAIILIVLALGGLFSAGQPDSGSGAP